MIATICDPLVWLGLACIATVLVLVLGAIVFAWLHQDRDEARRCLHKRIRITIDGMIVQDTTIEQAALYDRYVAADGILFDELLGGVGQRVVIRVIDP